VIDIRRKENDNMRETKSARGALNVSMTNNSYKTEFH
jgi:hypothetical protein